MAWPLISSLELLAACQGGGTAARVDAAAAPTADRDASAVSDDGSPCTTAVATLPEAPLRLATDGMHTCAWRAAGPVHCWGRNDTGQLGDGTTNTRLTPTPAAVAGVLQVSVGDWNNGGFSCALLADRTVACWGRNEEGQLGDGTIWPYRTRPVAVVGLSDVAEIVSATNHSSRASARARSAAGASAATSPWATGRARSAAARRRGRRPRRPARS